MRRFYVFLLLALTLVLALSACGSSSGGAAKATVPAATQRPTSTTVEEITINVYDNYFDPQTVIVPAEQPVGVTFINKGANVHIVEILGLFEETPLQPGQSKRFILVADPHPYKMYDEIYVSKGMVGSYIGGTNAAQATPTGSPPATIQAAIQAYLAYVQNQANQLVENTQTFTDAVLAGNLDQAKALFAPTRQYYERIEPIAESFGDLDPQIDARQNDVPAGQWRGFHEIEQALWVQGTTAGQEQYARQLLADVQELNIRVASIKLTSLDIIEGAVALLDEASSTKITGEEDRYSHTDLSDLAANTEGSQAAFEEFANYLNQKNPALVNDVEAKFQAVEAAILPYRRGSGFVAYNTLTPDQTRPIAQALDAAAEALSKVANELPPN